MTLRIPVLLDCRNPVPPYDNKHVALQSFPLRKLIELIYTVDALFLARALMGNALIILTAFALA